jgi:hypothetical protein
MRCGAESGRRQYWRPALYLLPAILTAACSVPPEQPIVSDFFAASRLRDTTALARFATVVFEPRERGIVDMFHIESVSPERTSGAVRVKQVRVRASIRGADGRIGEQVLTVTLQKRQDVGDPRALYGGWIVTGVTDAEASRAAPRS